MTMFTWSDIRTKIENDLGIQDEQWVTEPELMGYCNEAIRECEAVIHGLYEDYFLDYASVTFVAGADEVDLPTGCYAHKIRRFLFVNGANRYVINRLKDWKKFENKSETDYYGGQTQYSYMIGSPTAGAGSKIILTPSIRSADAGAFGKIWFIRESNAIATSSDTCDVPEFINFVYAHMKLSIYAKEGHPLLGAAAANLDKQRALMEATLSAMVPDADNEIEPDLDLYEEMN